VRQLYTQVAGKIIHERVSVNSHLFFNQHLPAPQNKLPKVENSIEKKSLMVKNLSISLKSAFSLTETR